MHVLIIAYRTIEHETVYGPLIPAGVMRKVLAMTHD